MEVSIYEIDIRSFNSALTHQMEGDDDLGVLNLVLDHNHAHAH